MRQAMKEISKGVVGIFIIIGVLIAIVCIALGAFYLGNQLGYASEFGVNDSDPWIIKAIAGILMTIIFFFVSVIAISFVIVSYLIGEGAFDYIKNLGQSGINRYTDINQGLKLSGPLASAVRWLKDKLNSISLE